MGRIVIRHEKAVVDPETGETIDVGIRVAERGPRPSREARLWFGKSHDERAMLSTEHFLEDGTPLVLFAKSCAAKLAPLFFEQWSNLEVLECFEEELNGALYTCYAVKAHADPTLVEVGIEA